MYTQNCTSHDFKIVPYLYLDVALAICMQQMISTCPTYPKCCLKKSTEIKKNAMIEK